MDNFFSGVGGPTWDFAQITATFLLTMLVLFGVKNRRYRWLHYFMPVVLALQCLLIIAFHNGLEIKLFAVLMLTSTVIVVIIQRGKRVQSNLG